MFFYSEPSGVVAVPLILTSSVNSITFADISVNTSSSQTFTVSAGGLSSVEETVAVSDDSSQFDFSPSSFSLTGSGASQTVTVKFTPTTTGVKTANLTLSSSGGNSNIISLLGTALPVVDWKLSSYTQTGSLQITGETSPSGMWFKPDGTKLYVAGWGQNKIQSWNLTTPWDITTATNLVSMSTALKLANGSTTLAQASGIAFSNDGLYAFVTDLAYSTLCRYNLSVAWDLTTLNVTASQQNSSDIINGPTPHSIWISPDGLNLSITNTYGGPGATTVGFKSYTTSTPNSIASLVLTSAVYEHNCVGGMFVNDGKRFISVRQISNIIEMSNELSTPYIFNGWSRNNSINIATLDGSPQDVYMKSDGTRFYYLGASNTKIFQFII